MTQAPATFYIVIQHLPDEVEPAQGEFVQERMGLVEAVLQSARAAIDLRDEAGMALHVALHDVCPPRSRLSHGHPPARDRDDVDGWVRPLKHLRAELGPQHPVAWGGVARGRAALEHARQVGATAHALLAEAETLPGKLLGAIEASGKCRHLHIRLPWSKPDHDGVVSGLPTPLWGVALLVEAWLEKLQATWKAITDAEPTDSTIHAATLHIEHVQQSAPTPSPTLSRTDLAKGLDGLFERCVEGRHAWSAGDLVAMMRAHVEVAVHLDWLQQEHRHVRRLAPTARAASYAVTEGADLSIGGHTAPAEVRSRLANAFRARRDGLFSGQHAHHPELLPPFVDGTPSSDRPNIAESRDQEEVAFVAWWFARLARVYAANPNQASAELQTTAVESLRTWADALLALQLVIGCLCGSAGTTVSTDTLARTLEAARRTLTREGSVRARLEVERWQVVLACLQAIDGPPDRRAIDGPPKRLVDSLRAEGLNDTARRVAYFLRAFDACTGREERLERAWQVAILYYHPPQGPEWHADVSRSTEWTRRVADVLDGPRPGLFAAGPPGRAAHPDITTASPAPEGDMS
jgi:hypothetical protein